MTRQRDATYNKKMNPARAHRYYTYAKLTFPSFPPSTSSPLEALLFPSAPCLPLSLFPFLIQFLSLFLGGVLALLLNESDISWSKGSRPQVELGNLEFPTHASIVCHIIYGVASYIVNYYEVWVLLGCCDRSVLCSASGNLTPFDQLTELPCCTTFNCFHTRST